MPAPDEAPKQPVQVQRFQVLHENLGMLVTYTWPEELLRALQRELSVSIQPATVVAAFLQRVAVDVTFTTVAKAPGIKLPGAGVMG